MASSRLHDLEVAFFEAKEARSRAKNTIRLLTEMKDEIRKQWLADAKKARENQALHDQVDVLYDRNLKGGRYIKAYEKKVRRNSFGNEAQAARIERDRLKLELTQLEDQIAWQKKDFNIQGRSARYYKLRHQMMEERKLVEQGDVAALEVKRAYMKYARILQCVAPADVLYYTENGNRRVHLFYGGKASFDGPGNSPDGVGHGHVIIGVGKWEPYYVKFTRPPE